MPRKVACTGCRPTGGNATATCPVRMERTAPLAPSTAVPAGCSAAESRSRNCRCRTRTWTGRWRRPVARWAGWMFGGSSGTRRVHRSTSAARSHLRLPHETWMPTCSLKHSPIFSLLASCLAPPATLCTGGHFTRDSHPLVVCHGSCVSCIRAARTRIHRRRPKRNKQRSPVLVSQAPRPYGQDSLSPLIGTPVWPGSNASAMRFKLMAIDAKQKSVASESSINFLPSVTCMAVTGSKSSLVVVMSSCFTSRLGDLYTRYRPLTLSNGTP